MNGVLPQWNSAGVLPPVRPEMPGSTSERSPYRVALSTLIDRFAITQERMAILDGLLKFREKLHSFGIVSGFQWLNGSFLENIEILEDRQPRDIDVVTFFDLPAGETQESLVKKAGQLFDQKYLKDTFSVDAYYEVLGQPTDSWKVQRISYWYSMWSHRRNGIWKGFAQVDLSPLQDSDVRALMNLSGGVCHE